MTRRIIFTLFLRARPKESEIVSFFKDLEPSMATYSIGAGENDTFTVNGRTKNVRAKIDYTDWNLTLMKAFVHTHPIQYTDKILFDEAIEDLSLAGWTRS